MWHFMEMLLKDGLEELGYPEGKNMTFHPILPASGAAKHKSLTTELWGKNET